MVRTIQGTVPSYTLSNYGDVANAGRVTTPNADHLITDIALDAAGNQIGGTDARGVVTNITLDSRSRVTEQVRDPRRTRPDQFYRLRPQQQRHGRLLAAILRLGRHGRIGAGL